MRKIVAVFAKHGFEDLAERIELGQFIINKFRSPESANLSTPERLRLCLEELGPTFIKLGQVLATRPDLVAPAVAEEFSKLHDQVPALSFAQIKPALQKHFGKDLSEIFLTVDETPLAAASIAQVHRAQLRDGRHVVIKILRPGLDRVIAQDLDLMYAIAGLFEKYVPESRSFNLPGIIEEFFNALRLETNLAIEANNIRRFRSNFEGFPNVKIPDVISELSGEKVLVLEEISGLRLSQFRGDPLFDPDQILRTGLKAYFKMVFTDGFFHGDLHPGNIFLLSNNQIGLIDFGVVGRLNNRVKTTIANMLVCLATEDYDRLAQEYVDLAPYSEHVDVDALARKLRNLISPYYGMTLKHIDAGKLLLNSAGVAAEHKLVLPTDLVLFFKSVVGLEAVARVLNKEFDFLTEAIEFSSELIQLRYDPVKISKDFLHWGRDIQQLMLNLPRQLRLYFRRVNSPEHVFRVELKQIDDLGQVLMRSAALMFWGFLIAAFLLSGAMTLDMKADLTIFGMPSFSFVVFLFAGLSSFWVFFNYRR